ncbi:unnamed protein product, partial [Rotaria sp. Silwood1]
VLVNSPILHPQETTDAEFTNKHNEQILNDTQFDNAIDQQWEPYNGCNWSNESKSINWETSILSNIKNVDRKFVDKICRFDKSGIQVC